MEREDMLKILKLLHDLGPWDDSPLLLAHAQRFVPKSSELPGGNLLHLPCHEDSWTLLERSPFSTILNLQEIWKKIFCCLVLKIVFVLFLSPGFMKNLGKQLFGP